MRTHSVDSVLNFEVAEEPKPGQGKISEQRCTQMIAKVEASTDKVVETVERTTREILANLERRSHAALKQA